jgi:hypothetical protein
MYHSGHHLSLLILLLGIVGGRDSVRLLLLLGHGILLHRRSGRGRLLLELTAAARVGRGCAAGVVVKSGLAVTVQHDAVRGQGAEEEGA